MDDGQALARDHRYSWGLGAAARADVREAVHLAHDPGADVFESVDSAAVSTMAAAPAAVQRTIAQRAAGPMVAGPMVAAPMVAAPTVVAPRAAEVAQGLC